MESDLGHGMEFWVLGFCLALGGPGKDGTVYTTGVEDLPLIPDRRESALVLMHNL